MSPGQAGVLARTSVAIDAIPGPGRGAGGVDEQAKAEVLAVLLGFADRLDVAQLGKAAARARFLLDRDAGARLAREEEAQQESQGAWLVPSPTTGMWHGRLDLAPVDGAYVHAVLDVLAPAGTGEGRQP